MGRALSHAPNSLSVGNKCNTSVLQNYATEYNHDSVPEMSKAGTLAMTIIIVRYPPKHFTLSKINGLGSLAGQTLTCTVEGTLILRSGGVYISPGTSCSGPVNSLQLMSIFVFSPTS